MKTKLLLLILISGFLISCSDSNKPYIEKIKQQIKENALGVDLNYKSIEFKWIDTLFVDEKLLMLKQNFSQRIDTLLQIEFFIQDNFEKGRIFSKAYITRERLIELRNWEKKNRGIPFNKEYKDYYLFAFDNRDASSWISDLCRQIEESDKLIENYENLTEGDLPLLENVLWYYNRIDVYNSNNSPHRLWSIVSSEINELKTIKTVIDSLTAVNPEKVVNYKALNIFTINNPLLNGAKQELKKVFIFDENFNIISQENIEK